MLLEQKDPELTPAEVIITCPVCKQPMHKIAAVSSPFGLVHSGPCAQYAASNKVLAESHGQLAEVELLV